MILYRLRGRKTCDRVLRRGRTWKGKTMIIRWLPASAMRATAGKPGQPGLYVGTLASTKLSKKAVERNRMRRRCREALRTIVREQGSLPSAQLLLCPRSASLRSPFAAIQGDITAFLSVFR